MYSEGQRSARRAGLHYVDDSHPGITRQRCGRGFRYVDANGRVIRDVAELKRINSLAVPPAWDAVWISSDPLAHIQATARDARGRKQYRYHPLWQALRSDNKFARMLAFADVLPALRTRIAHDLAIPTLTREKVIAGILKLMEVTRIRIGNETYARSNRSYGLTTLRCRHVDIDGVKIELRFRGKSGQYHRIALRDARLTRLLESCRELPGAMLFQFVDDVGMRHTVDSNSVNAYIHQVCGQRFSAKDFRTWAGTHLAVSALAEVDTSLSMPRQIQCAMVQVAEQLGNTAAVCKRSYVHPAVIDAHTQGWLLEAISRLDEGSQSRGLHKSECAMLAVLRGHRARQFLLP